MEKPTSFRPSEANKVVIDSANNKNTVINEALDLLRDYHAGNIVKINEVLKGQTSDKCIFGFQNIDPVTESIEDKCPIKTEYPSLKEGANAEILLKFCSHCPFKSHDKEIYKIKAKYPTAFKHVRELEDQQLDAKPRETAVAMAAVAPTLAAESKRASQALVKVERSTPPAGRPASSKTAHVKCDECNFAIWQDHDIESIEKAYINHIADEHNRVISTNEMNQLKHARRVILGNNAA